ncbi:hypothetical protein E2C01_060543 [Portunus trituberculatus]|uniref:Uncharacterized protein n=1 Tax=Portunus trituberculatus TaxID=210409 RepID=A0A5B7H8Z7_PORTR|nr:hypothetical protein [Portunus trituberculatus]
MEHSRARWNKAGQDGARQGKMEQTRARWSKAGQDGARQSKMEEGRARQGKGGQDGASRAGQDTLVTPILSTFRRVRIGDTYLFVLFLGGRDEGMSPCPLLPNLLLPTHPSSSPVLFLNLLFSLLSSSPDSSSLL